MIIHGAHPGDDDYEYGFDSKVDGVITPHSTMRVCRLAEADIRELSVVEWHCGDDIKRLQGAGRISLTDDDRHA